MSEIKKVLLCGLGAVGTAIANRILNCPQTDLKILVDNIRFNKYSNNPRIYNGKPAIFNYITPDNTAFHPDLIIIAVKFSGLNSVIQNLRNFISQNTIILPVLNGITADEILAENFGTDKVISGFYIGNSAMRDGENITNDGIFKLVFGSDNVPKEKINALKTFFENCGQDYNVPEDIQHAKWCKFALNIVCNQLSAILRFDFAEMKRNKEFHKLSQKILGEVVAIAKAEGVKNPNDLQKYAINALLNLKDNGKTSMLQDIEQGRKTEVNIFSGKIIDLGKKYNIPTPYNKVIYDLINILEN